MAKEKGKVKGYEKLGCLMVDMPKEVDSVIRKFVSDNINDKGKLYYSDKFDYVQGIPENFHVTVKYGLYEINDSGIKKLYKPIKLKLGKIDKFKQDDYDVLIVKIESEDLMELNKKVCEEFENKTTFEYSPHLTLAYVTTGSYDNLVGKNIDNRKNVITLGKDKYIYKPYKGVTAMAHTPEEWTKWEKEVKERGIEDAKGALQKNGYPLTPKNINTVIKYWAKGYARATMPWAELEKNVNASKPPKYNVGEMVKVVKGENEGKEGKVLEVDIYTEDEGWKSNMIVPYVYFINFEGANKDNPNDWIMEEDIMGVNKVESAKQSEQKFERNDVVEIVNGEHEGSVGIIEDAEYDENYWRDAGGEWVYTIENAEDEELIEGVAESDIKMAESGKDIESAVRIPIEIKVYFEDSNKLNAIGKEFADSTLDYGAWVNVDISGEGGMSIEDAENMISWDAEVYDINYNNYQPNLQTEQDYAEQDYVGDNVMDLIYTYYSSWFGLSTNKIKNIEVIFKGKVPGYDSSEQIKSKTKVKAEGNNENDNETVEVSNDEILEQFRKENTHKFRVYEDIRSGNEAPISKLKEVIQKGIEALDDYTMDNAAEYVGDIAYDTVENWLKEEGYTEVSDEVKDEMRYHIEELADYNVEDLFDYPVLLKKYYGEIYHEEGVVLSYDNVVWTDEANKWKAEALKYITQKDLERICNNSTYGGDAFVGGIVSGKEIIETIMKGEKEVQVDTIIIGIHDSANGSGFYEEGNGKLKINFDEAKLDVGSYSLGAVFGTGEWIYSSINKNVQASRTKPNMHRLKKPVETLLKKRGVDFEVIDINQVTDDKVWVDVYYKDKEDYDMMVIERSQLNDNEVEANDYKTDKEIEDEFKDMKITEFEIDPRKTINQDWVSGRIVIEFPNAQESVGGGTTEVVDYWTYSNKGQWAFDKWYPENVRAEIKKYILDTLKKMK